MREERRTGKVIREALRDRREQAIEELGRLWDEGLASGQSLAGPDAFDRIRERLSQVTNGEP